MGSADRLTGPPGGPRHGAPDPQPPGGPRHCAAERLLTGGPRHVTPEPESLPVRARRTAGSVAWTVSATWLLTLACLTGWALLPTALGWRPVLVGTGSMAPALEPGDVLLVAPEVPRSIVGHVLLIGVPGGTDLVHRAAAPGPPGTVVTRGDANPTPDAEPVALSRVEGIGRLVVPEAGRMLLAVRRQAAADVPWLAALAAAVLVLAVTTGTDGRAAARRRGSHVR